MVNNDEKREHMGRNNDVILFGYTNKSFEPFHLLSNHAHTPFYDEHGIKWNSVAVYPDLLEGLYLKFF